MARVTVEDCIKKMPNRFDLVLAASERARKLDRSDGESPLNNGNDKNTVVALREIAEGMTADVVDQPPVSDDVDAEALEANEGDSSEAPAEQDSEVLSSEDGAEAASTEEKE